MELVDFDKLPKREEIKDVPLDNPIEIFKICQEMQIVCEREGGIGLSAVQVGIPWNLFIIKSDGSCPFIEKGQYGYFLNTDYKVTIEKPIVSMEGCLSIRSKDGQLRLFQVTRNETVHILGQRLLFDKVLSFVHIDVEVSAAEGGVIFQHEIDHAKSILISDIGKEIFIW